MGAGLHAVRGRGGQGLVHHQRVAGVEAAGDVGRGRHGQHLGVVAKR